jgi:predicted NAD/FAD-dependent oxidoreductase
MKVTVIGAGMSGLIAARDLAAANHDVVVLDKGRGVGGRMATRRIGNATIDHGAQFFTVRSNEFERDIIDWLRHDVVVEWCRGFDAVPDGYPRYAGRGGMTALAKHLAQGLDVRTSSMAFAVRANGAEWEVQLDDGSIITSDAVVATCPVPQSYSLLMTTDIRLPRDLLASDYERTLAVLVELDRPSQLRHHGVAPRDHSVFSMVVDNQLKGISQVPALTMHTNAAWSLARWDDPHEVTLAALIAQAAPFIGNAEVLNAQLKRWRFATPTAIWPEPCWIGGNGTIVVAGDAFAGPKIEGAYRSGRAAAQHLLSR